MQRYRSSRRHACGLAALAAAFAAAGPVASAPARCARHFPPVIRDGFPAPTMRFSHGGRLETTLRASVGPVTIGGRRITTMNYEGVYPSPTLVVCPGDDLTVHLVNDLPSESTNLHMHGFHVSPSGHSDNVFLDIGAGQRFTYRYHLPLDHPPGAYWYHPHHHGHVEPQIFAGMAGAVVVQGGLDDLLPDVPQRLMVITNTQLTPDGHTVPGPDSTDAKANLYVNGRLNPVVRIRPGEIQRWRLFNLDADRIVVLRLQGQRMEVLAEDGNTLAAMRPNQDLRLAPGSRREVLVRGGRPGEHPLMVRAFTQRPGDALPARPLLTVRSAGSRAHDRLPTGRLARPVDLRGRHVDRRRHIVFSASDDSPPEFMLNHQTFDPSRTDVTMKLGSLEEWTLVNAASEWHTFHIHINPFQVLSTGGRRTRYVQYRDNLALPPHSTSVIRMRPVDFTGRFVFHCHVTFHEDHGMMAVVAVRRRLTRSQRAASAVHRDGLMIHSMRMSARRRGSPTP